MKLLDEAKTAVEKAKSRYPDLIWQGMAVKNKAGAYIDYDGYKTWELPKEYIERSRDQFNPEQVATAIAYLRTCQPAKKPKANSYYLKHRAEDWGSTQGMSSYVANGELIAAAVFLDLPIEVE